CAAHEQHELADRALAAESGGHPASLAGGRRVRLQVQAGAEGAPRAAEDEDPRLAIVGQLPEELPELADERRVERVQRVRTMEREPGEMLFTIDAQRFEHGVLPSVA